MNLMFAISVNYMARSFVTSRENIPVLKDGKCSIFTLDSEGVKVDKYLNVWYEERVVGFNRHFTAKSVQVKVDRLIRIHKLTGINNYDQLEIPGEGIFQIEMIQVIFDSNPPCLDLTLKQLEMFKQ